MGKPSPLLDTAKLPSFLSGAALIFYAAAAISGIPGVILLLSPAYRLLLLRDLIDGGIQDASSLLTWQVINSCITVLICVLPVIMAAGLFLARRG